MSIDNNMNIAKKSELIDNDNNNKGDDIFSRNPLEGINWNQIEDQTDKDVFDRLVSNFWVPEKVSVSNDQNSWRNLNDAERNATMKVFAGLTLLDTIQGDIGAVSLLPDSRSLHESAVYANIHFMEAFSGDTELLTPQGWKQIKDITEDDKVSQYNPESGLLEFTTPKVVPSHYSEEVYEIVSNNGNARQVVSGGHRVYLEEKVKKNNQCQEWSHRVVEARDLVNVNLNTAHRRFRSTGQAPYGEGMSDLDRILVAINADGSFLSGSIPRHTGEKTGTIPCQFSFSKERKITRLEELAESVGWKLTHHGISEREGDVKNQEVFKLHVPLDYVKDRSKRFNQWWTLEGISNEWARDFINENGLWDGHTLKGGEGVTYYTSSEEDRDFFVAVASLAGLRSRSVIREDDRSESYSNNYVTYVSFTKDTVSAMSMNVNKVEPQEVYCVQVPTTFLLTRNGESPVISGNCIHAKSYSNIFMTLSNTPEIDEAFRWARENSNLQYKAHTIVDLYNGDDPLKRKIASVLLESFLFYSGFYLPFRFSSMGRLTNTADIIRLIVRDESIHGYYIGYRYQVSANRLTEEQREEYKEFTIGLLLDLYEHECSYAEEIYDPLGWTEDVKNFMRYNANKAINNLGFDNLFPADTTRVSPSVMSSMSSNADENHDFFSGAGSSYIIGDVEETSDDDWDF